MAERMVWDLFFKEGDNTLYGDDAARGDIMLGDNGNDKLFGLGGDDLLLGGRGRDTLHGGTGDDEVRGGGGDDWIHIDPGNNTYNGDAGTDTLDFSRTVVVVEGGLFGASNGTMSAMGGVSVDLVTGVTRQQSLGSDEYDVNLGTNSFSSIERYEMTDGDDVIRGDSTGDVFLLNGGNDFVEGRGGADRIIGDRSVGFQGDNFEAGFDTASYESSPSRVDVDLMRGGGQSGGHAEGDVLIGIEGLRGSHHGDRLAGDGAANAIDGGAGRDEILGRGGTDTLTGGAGADVFIFEQTSDSTGNFLQRDTITDFQRGFPSIPSGIAERIPEFQQDRFDIGGIVSGGGGQSIPAPIGDRIDLSAIDADQRVGQVGNQNFTFIGDAAFTAAGQLRVVAANDLEGRAFNLVQGDTNGDGNADFSLNVYTTNGTTLQAGDFNL